MMELITPVDMDVLDAVLDEAIGKAEYWESSLTKGTKKGKAQLALEALRNGKVELANPAADIACLHPGMFEGKQLAELQEEVVFPEGYHYYVIPVPVILWPERGAEYRLVECQLTFDAQGADDVAVAVQRVFPEPAWKSVLAYGAQAHLGLDGALKWGVEIKDIELQTEKFDAALSARVTPDLGAAGFVKIFPFTFTLGRAEIEAQFGGGQALWRLDCEDVIREHQQVRFVVILKVPQAVEAIELQAVAQAEVNYHWLIAQVEHIFDRLPEALRERLRGGGADKEKKVVLQDDKHWTLCLPACSE
jgi:hypothetical protein